MSMHSDHLHRHPVSTPSVVAAALGAVALIAILANAPKPAEPDSSTAAAAEDWHGNVMRSHWRPVMRP
jgi:hypothetical protein